MLTIQTMAKTIATECACLQLRQAARVVTRDYDDALRSVGLRASQITMLVAVAMFGERGASMNALADAIVMDRTTLTRNLKPMTDAGLLQLEKSKAGQDALRAAYPLWEQAQKAARKKVGAAEFGALTADLRGAVKRLTT
jgi:DNA-binding MarR family transcriptional regulator